MTICVKAVTVVTALFWAQLALAQSWVQVEARPNEAQALERAADYASRLADVNGFRLRSGWFAIALGPFSEAEALARLSQLRLTRAVPSDSFISDGSNFAGRFFGSENAALAAPAVTEPLPPLEPGEETLAEARAGERDLTRDDRELIQIALRWEGFYNSVIDASFGPGTRNAMAAWQQDRRYEPTGVLTTLQRRELVDGYRSVLSALDMTPETDTQAGIEIALPQGLVAFDRYEPPFVHYKSTTDEGVRVILISQTGDEATLTALYDIMQTLEIVPLNGPRDIGRGEFTLTGTNDNITSHTYAQLSGGSVKGFTLIWPAGDEKRFRLALSAMQNSFRAIDGVLPDTAGTGTQDIDLLSGLDIRRPDRSRSGFFIDSAGSVLTTTEAVRQCARITLNDEAEAEIAAEDTSLGLALLRPRQSLSPLSVARLSANQPRLQSDVAVAGYTFGGVLSAPSLTFGTLADVKGLDGDTRIQRLEVVSEDGDTGGPVFDGSGAVMGMLLAPSDSARQLPGNVAFAADAPVLAEFLSQNGVNPAASDSTTGMAPEDLTLLAADLTVLVSCWN
jgi:S1-C subfamily serine protease